jgi:hypothetical protein
LVQRRSKWEKQTRNNFLDPLRYHHRSLAPSKNDEQDERDTERERERKVPFLDSVSLGVPHSCQFVVTKKKKPNVFQLELFPGLVAL